MRLRGAAVVLVMAGSALVAPPAVAQADPPPDTSVNYAYDAAGRLAGVTQQQSGSAGYRYDPNGNLTTIHRQAASALSVLSVVPAAGSSGQTVTLHGAGFVLPASENTVLFGETAATGHRPLSRSPCRTARPRGRSP
ncbi:IPT/TIG domain-containing protein [Fodinicola feengrottensis]|uniref:IPT/TIG domain-containing protein n=1 Tax=Fodinicola feengrottensis TaxID=435914 RepID=UPI0013D349CB|nr:IPT/TIG domain-containing protein [Fodinicola feengrottensis]